MKKNLLNSLAGMAMLFGLSATNVFAQDVKIDFEDEDVSMFNIFDKARLSITAVDDETTGSKVANFTCTNRNVLPLGLYDFTELTAQAATVDIEFDFNMGGVSGHHKITIGDALVHNADQAGFSVSSKNNYGYGANGAIIYFGTDRGNLGGGNENYFKINETPMAATTLDIKADQVFGQWLHAKVSVNVEAKTVSYVISNAEETLFEETDLPFISEGASACTEFDVSFSNTGTTLLDNLTISSVKSEAKFADYLIKYVDEEGNELKEARKTNGKVGEKPSLIDNDKANFTADYAGEGGLDGKMKYIYVSNNAEELAIEEEGTVVTVTFRKAAIFGAVLNCFIEGTTTYLNKDYRTFDFFEEDKLSVYPSRCYVKDGVYYSTAATSYNGVTFTFAPTKDAQGNWTLAGGTTQTVKGKKYFMGTLYYTADESVAYYSDFERLALPVEDEGNGTGLGQVVGNVLNWWSFTNGYFDRLSGGRGIRLATDSYVYTEPIAEDGTYMVTIYGRNDKSENTANPYALGQLAENGDIELFDVAIPDWGSATTGSSVVGADYVEPQDAVLYTADDEEVISGDKQEGEEKTPAVEAKDGTGIGIKAGTQLVVMNTGNGDNICLDDIKLKKVADYAETPITTVVTTAINTVRETAQPMTGIIYNLQGQVVKNAVKGLYIHNGKKFIVK